MSEPAEVLLFAYGTLQFRKVQEAHFGRLLEGRRDILPGYIVLPLEITDPDVFVTSGTAHHTSVRETGDPRDKMPGTLFRITQAELAAADAYEVADVKRVCEAWIGAGCVRLCERPRENGEWREAMRQIFRQR